MDSTLEALSANVQPIDDSSCRMAKKEKKNLHAKIVKVLEEHPEGLNIHEIRAHLPADIGPQQHLDKRVRELYYEHDIAQEGGRYIYRSKRAEPRDNQGIKAPLRAAVLNMAHGRCQMCGRTVAEDKIKLEADHKIPRNWGGPTTIENLWAVCGLCNGGKRDFFATFDDKEMAEVSKIDSVHHRLAHVLKRRGNEGAPSWFLQSVANLNDFQEDWQRRVRELREFKLDYKVTKRKIRSGKVEATYKLTKWAKLPPNPGAIIRAKERARRAKRRGAPSSEPLRLS